MSSRSGGLLELVARGKKDVFFIANPSTAIFHSVYTRAAPFTKEIYVSESRNTPEFGHWVDFDVDHRGDIHRHFYLRIALPTWLPPAAAAANATGIVTDASGMTYGYTNNIGFQVLEKIQFFMDQVLIHETYGEYLDWRMRQAYDFAKTYLIAEEVGARDESALGIGRSASPAVLRVPIPMLGWSRLFDPGLPMAALRSQRFRIRVHLRRLEELIVSSDGRVGPAPWNIPLRVQATRDGPVDETMRTLARTALPRPILRLEQTVLYVPPDIQTWLRGGVFRLPFPTIQFQQFTIEDTQLTAAAANPGGVYTQPFEVDFVGSCSRMLLGFRSAACTRAGQRDVLVAPNGAPFVRDIRFNVASIDRIKRWPLPVLREVTAYWKNRRLAFTQGATTATATATTTPLNVFTLAFGGFDRNDPEGTLNLTRASLPALHVTLNAVPYDRRNVSRQTAVILYAECWNLYEIGGGKGAVLFDY
jgi:hypothetical protein